MKIQQLLHGYRRGHQLLASSVKLSSRDADLVERISDLSGSLIVDSEFQPYITSYPLADAAYYALAKTWLDAKSQRSGCVITHTILIPINDWANSPCPQSFAKLLSLPQDSDSVDKFSTPISFNVHNEVETLKSVNIQEDVVLSFVSKYFGEGLRPLVWFGELNAQDMFWLIINKLWPNLRKQFSCCTYSLQPRMLEGRPFDLMFAPSAVYSRFQKIPRENRLDESSPISYSKTVNNSVEPWYQEWACAIIGNYDSNKISKLTDELIEIGPYLGEDPTEVKKIFLISEYRKRVPDSPSAAVGFMDIVESLMPLGNQAIDFKKGVVEQVLQILTPLKDDNADVLKYYYLVAERLNHAAFKNICLDADQKIQSAVALLASSYPSAALNVGYNYFTSRSQDQQSAFVKGVLDGLRKLAEVSPNKLNVLEQYSDLASILIAWEPKIAVGYLRGIKTQKSYPQQGSNLLVWIASLSNDTYLASLREALLPEIVGDDEASLAEELLKNLPEEEISRTLNILIKSTDKFSSLKIRQVAIEQLAHNYPDQLRAWSGFSKEWSSDLAAIVAATYSSDRNGLKELIKNPLLEPLRQAQTVCAFVDRIASHQLPTWLRDYIKSNPEILTSLLVFGRNTPRDISRVIERLLRDVREIPIAQLTDLVSQIDNIKQASFGDLLINQIMRSAIDGFISGNINWDTSLTWYSTSVGKQWVGTISNRELESIVTGKCSADGESWFRAWHWISLAPESIFRRSPEILPQLLDHLLNCYRTNWEFNIADYWVKILQRSSLESSGSTHLRLCSDALRYSLNHENQPVGKVIIESFWTVYSAVTESNSTPIETSDLFNVFDWDKGKELRRKIVYSFYRSNWSPGDLALAAHDESLIRKIFKRLMRKWDGEKYVQTMLKDLAKRKDPASLKMHAMLAELARNPDFREPWD